MLNTFENYPPLPNGQDVTTSPQEKIKLPKLQRQEVYKRANKQLAALFSNGERARNFGFAVFVFLMLSACGSTDLSEPAPQIPDDTPPVTVPVDIDALNAIVGDLSTSQQSTSHQFADALFGYLFGNFGIDVDGCELIEVGRNSSLDACIAALTDDIDTDDTDTANDIVVGQYDPNIRVRDLLSHQDVITYTLIGVNGDRSVGQGEEDNNLYLLYKQFHQERGGKAMAAHVRISREELEQAVNQAQRSAEVQRGVRERVYRDLGVELQFE